ncbi:MAG: RNA polymerase sigma factor [Roseivirga sp.]|nr:RNA polymerase sigma factor [Roseivirga sp.]
MERNSDQIFDELLVMKCQDQDQKAYALLWKRWQPRILKWSFSFINDADIAKEIAQESWVSIHKGIGKLRDPALFRFWAYKIVQRRSADWIRKEQRKRSSMEEVRHETPVSEEETKETVDPVDTMLASIKTLPEEHQRILRLFYLEKVPVKALAKMLKLPEGTIKSRLYYAREQLKKKLKNRNHE